MMIVTGARDHGGNAFMFLVSYPDLESLIVVSHFEWDVDIVVLWNAGNDPR